MANDRRPVLIHETSFHKGVHGGMHPSTLKEGYLARGLNVSVRGGYASTRPRFKTLADLQVSGDFKGVGVYSLDDGDELFVAVGRKVYPYNLETETWGTTLEFETETDQVYFVQADRYFIIQNGVDRPWFVHRNNFSRRANPDGDPDRELPTGTIMEYAHGRTFIVPTNLYDASGNLTTETGRPYWMAGDILLPLDPENVLKVTEDTYWQTGGATALPFESGYITGLAVLHNATASGSGLGALLAFGRGGVSAYIVAANREDWKDLDFSQVLFTGAGTESPKAIVPVNDDLLFRAVDGIRSIRVTSQQTVGAGGSWSVKPMSFEVDHRLSLDSSQDLPYVTAAFAGNRFLSTTAGMDGDAFNGILSLDTFVTSTLTQSYPPAYDDLWVSKPVHAVTRARINKNPSHIQVFSTANGIRIATLSDTETLDFGSEPPKCRVITRMYGTRTNDRAELQFVDAIFRGIEGDFTAKVYFRSEQYERWTPASGVLNVTNGATRAHARFSAETAGCLEDGTPPNIGYGLQVCIEWDGVATLEHVTASMEVTPTDPGAVSPCRTTSSQLSSDLDLAMVPLDDIQDAKVAP